MFQTLAMSFGRLVLSFEDTAMIRIYISTYLYSKHRPDLGAREFLHWTADAS